MSPWCPPNDTFCHLPYATEDVASSIHDLVNLLYCLPIILSFKESCYGHCQNPSGYFSASCCSVHAGRVDPALLGQHRSDPSGRLARDGACALACRQQEIVACLPGYES